MILSGETFIGLDPSEKTIWAEEFGKKRRKNVDSQWWNSLEFAAVELKSLRFVVFVFVTSVTAGHSEVEFEVCSSCWFIHVTIEGEIKRRLHWGPRRRRRVPRHLLLRHRDFYV